jgi:hypothetical protein
VRGGEAKQWRDGVWMWTAGCKRWVGSKDIYCGCEEGVGWGHDDFDEYVDDDGEYDGCEGDIDGEDVGVTEG